LHQDLLGANAIPAGEGCGAFAERAVGMRRAFAYRSIIF
jgi:hypothetical protein